MPDKRTSSPVGKPRTEPRSMASCAPHRLVVPSIVERVADGNDRLPFNHAQPVSVSIAWNTHDQRCSSCGALQSPMILFASKAMLSSVHQCLVWQIPTGVCRNGCCSTLRLASPQSNTLELLATVVCCDDSFIVCQCEFCEPSVLQYAHEHQYVVSVFGNSTYQLTLMSQV